jgi:hypothetical protein
MQIDANSGELSGTNTGTSAPLTAPFPLPFRMMICGQPARETGAH